MMRFIVRSSSRSPRTPISKYSLSEGAGSDIGGIGEHVGWDDWDTSGKML